MFADTDGDGAGNMTENDESSENSFGIATGRSDLPGHHGHSHRPRIAGQCAGRSGRSRGCPERNGWCDRASRPGELLPPRCDRWSCSWSLESRPNPALGAGMAGRQTVFDVGNERYVPPWPEWESCPSHTVFKQVDESVEEICGDFFGVVNVDLKARRT